jgi:hypothetical protein
MTDSLENKEQHMADTSEYLTIAQFCAREGIALTGTQLQDFEAECAQYCQDHGIPIRRAPADPLSPDEEIVYHCYRLCGVLDQYHRGCTVHPACVNELLDTVTAFLERGLPPDILPPEEDKED